MNISPVPNPDPGLSDDKTITREQCVVHLKLLAALADLRATVSAIDGLFGIYDSHVENCDDKQKALVRIREKRWEVYTSRAVDRYADWWTRIIPSGELPTVSRINTIQSAVLKSHPLVWSAKHLPPLGKLVSNEKEERSSHIN